MENTGINPVLAELKSWFLPMQKIEKSLKNGIMTDWIIRCNKRGHYRNRKKKQYAGDFCKLRKAKTFYHRNKGQIDNVKYQQPATGQEVIFNGQGKIVTDIENIGTYNYFPVSESISDTTDLINAFLHIVFDVVPYYRWGNDEKDSTSLGNRLLGPENGPVLDSCLTILKIIREFERKNFKLEK